MKKKIFSLLLVLCLAVPALLLGGCEKDLTIQEYTDYSKNALTNTYNHVLTDKNDLSTQKDFKMTATTVTKRYDETGKLVETTTIIETQERKGQGADTVYVVTTVNKSSLFNVLTEQYDENQTTTKEIYTKMTTAQVVTYHKLREYTDKAGVVTKSVSGTYTEDLFVTTVYNLSAEAMDDIADIHISGEAMLIVLIGEVEAKGNESKGTLKLNYSATEYDSYDDIIEEEQMIVSCSYKDNKLASTSQITKSLENNVLQSEAERVMQVEYSANVSAPASLADYVA